MSGLLKLILVSIATCMATSETNRGPQNLRNGVSVPSIPTASQAAAAAMARRFVHTDLLATRHKVFGRRSMSFDAQYQQSGVSAAWGVILMVIIPLVLIVFMVFVCIAGSDEDSPDAKTQQPLKPSAVMKAGYGASPQQRQNVPYSASPPQRPYSASPQQSYVAPTSPMVSADPFLTQHIQSASSIGASNMMGSPFQTQQRKSPVPSPAGSALLTSVPIWSSGARSNLPPQLCPAHPAAPGKATLKISKAALEALYKRHTVDVLGAFDYPLAYARLGNGPEGSRLELASEPSWNNIEVTLGPLAFPGNLSHDAMVHGPQRELYGPFQRTSTGFAVGHYSQPGCVLTLSPKMRATGICVDISDASDKQIATVTDNGPTFQIDISPGLDAFLVITSVLATFVASQFLIDELHTSIASL